MVCLYLYVIHELVSQLAVAEGGPSITETEATSLAGSRASTSRLERRERERERGREVHLNMSVWLALNTQLNT